MRQPYNNSKIVNPLVKSVAIRGSLFKSVQQNSNQSGEVRVNQSLDLRQIGAANSNSDQFGGDEGWQGILEDSNELLLSERRTMSTGRIKVQLDEEDMKEGGLLGQNDTLYDMKIVIEQKQTERKESTRSTMMVKTEIYDSKNSKNNR